MGTLDGATGTHNVSVVADASGTVTDSVYGVQVSAVVPYIKILYPDLNIRMFSGHRYP